MSERVRIHSEGSLGYLTLTRADQHRRNQKNDAAPYAARKIGV